MAGLRGRVAICSGTLGLLIRNGPRHPATGMACRKGKRDRLVSFLRSTPRSQKGLRSRAARCGHWCPGGSGPRRTRSEPGKAGAFNTVLACGGSLPALITALPVRGRGQSYRQPPLDCHGRHPSRVMFFAETREAHWRRRHYAREHESSLAFWRLLRPWLSLGISSRPPSPSSPSATPGHNRRADAVALHPRHRLRTRAQDCRTNRKRARNLTGSRVVKHRTDWG